MPASCILSWGTKTLNTIKKHACGTQVLSQQMPAAASGHINCTHLPQGSAAYVRFTHQLLCNGRPDAEELRLLHCSKIQPARGCTGSAVWQPRRLEHHGGGPC